MKPAAIADAIIQRELRTELGATPTATVGAKIYSSLKIQGAASPFFRNGKALFSLRTKHEPEPTPEEQKAIEEESIQSTSEITGLVNALECFGSVRG